MRSLSQLLEATPFALPLRAPFRGLWLREGVLLRGPGGWGEFAPFGDYDADGDARWLASALAAVTKADPVPPVRTSVPVNAILPEVPHTEVGPFVEAAVREQGCGTVKVKVGRADLADDVALVAAVRESLDASLGTGDGRIRIDANGRWTPRQAAAALEQLRGFGIEYVEQPCRTRAELRGLRRLDLGIPVAVDESIRVDHDWRGVADYADVAVLKVSPLGGPREVLRLAPELDVPVVLSGALESSIGLAQDVAVAAALPELPYACGFGTGTLLADDLVADPLLPRDGAIAVQEVAPDPVAVRRAADRLSADQRREWLDRLDAAWQRGLARQLVPPDIGTVT